MLAARVPGGFCHFTDEFIHKAKERGIFTTGEYKGEVGSEHKEKADNDSLQEVIFLSDLDGTWLSPKAENIALLNRGVEQLKKQYREKGIDLKFGYITARPPSRVEQEPLPEPDWTISYNGGYIHRGFGGHRKEDGTFEVDPPLESWEQLNKLSGFDARVVKQIMHQLLQRPEYKGLKVHTVGEVVGNPDADANPYTVALAFEDSSLQLTESEAEDRDANGIPDSLEADHFRTPNQLRKLVADLADELDKRGISYQLSPVYPFNGKPMVMLDAAAPLVSKGDVVEFLMATEHVSPDHLVVAGDGGNDISMMRDVSGHDDGRRVIVVGNNRLLRQKVEGVEHAIVRPPQEDSAIGVLKGLRQHLAEIAAGAEDK